VWQRLPAFRSDMERCSGTDSLWQLHTTVAKKNLGRIWVESTVSKSSLEDQERAVSTVEIQ
jgi:hypothetical protein